MSTAVQTLSQSAVDAFLGQLPDWRLDEAGAMIARTVSFTDFKAAFEFMTEVASFAELINHHPEWCNVWNRVDLKLTTHTAGGLTRADFELAGYIDRLLQGFTLLCSIEDGACSGCR